MQNMNVPQGQPTPQQSAIPPGRPMPPQTMPQDAQQATPPVTQQALPQDVQGAGVPPQQGASAQNDNEKEEFQRFQIDATKLLHSPQSGNEILKQVMSSGNLAKGLSDVALGVIQRVDTEYPLSPKSKILGAMYVVEDLAQTIEATKAVPQVDKKDKSLAVARAVQEMVKDAVGKGELDPKQAEQIMRGQQQATVPKKTTLPQVAQGVQPPPQPTAPPPQPLQPSQPQADNPIHPTTTMSQKLAGGLL